MNKIWFITGSSRGLGRALTQAVLAAGHSVVATARRPEQLNDLVQTYGNRICPVKLDVLDPLAAQAAVQTALDVFGRIDVLVNNAGYGFCGAFEEMTPEEFKGQIDTNFWGVVHVTRAALPAMRAQGAGHIIQITSVGGRLAVAAMSGYHAAKFAVEGLSEALAQEIKPLGLKLTVVEPGGFRTDWAGASMALAKPMEAYRASAGTMRGLLQDFAGHESGDPAKAAAAIIKITEVDAPPLRLLLGKDALALARQSYQQSLKDADQWAQMSEATDFDGQKSEAHAAVLKSLGVS